MAAQHSDAFVFKEENVMLRGGAQGIKRFRPVPCFLRHTAQSNLFLLLFQVWSQPNCRRQPVSPPPPMGMEKPSR